MVTCNAARRLCSIADHFCAGSSQAQLQQSFGAAAAVSMVLSPATQALRKELKIRARVEAM